VSVTFDNVHIDEVFLNGLWLGKNSGALSFPGNKAPDKPVVWVKVAQQQMKVNSYAAEY
jgi:hypothetical protein